MLNSNHTYLLKQIEAVDFSGRGEAFVEQKFVTPLLQCLGYEAHKDYEVLRHGDDGAAFKLSYPPVERGAARVRHYNPDYIPTVRKKMFWVIEAKSSKDTSHPFDTSYLVQGLQYCIHPEIQAKYLLVTNGLHSSVYDAHGSVFLGQKIYEPILEFSSSELISKWSHVFSMLSVETLRVRIEDDLKRMYDKLCLSSLDRNYPTALLKRIGTSAGENVKKIEKHVNKLYVENMDRASGVWSDELERFSPAQAFEMMELPLTPARTAAQTYVEKCLAGGIAPEQIFTKLAADFDEQSIFRKEQSFLGICHLYCRVNEPSIKSTCLGFFDHYKERELPLINQLECTLLRLTRKVLVLSTYSKIREKISRDLEAAPELIRYVSPPTALDSTLEFEIVQHREIFEQIKIMSDNQTRAFLDICLKAEADIESDFRLARSKLPDSEKQISGFESYGVGGKHYAFRNMLHNFGIQSRVDLTPPLT